MERTACTCGLLSVLEVHLRFLPAAQHLELEQESSTGVGPRAGTRVGELWSRSRNPTSPIGPVLSPAPSCIVWGPAVPTQRLPMKHASGCSDPNHTLTLWGRIACAQKTFGLDPTESFDPSNPEVQTESRL